MAKRSDIHRPGAIIPIDYDYVGQKCIKIESVADCVLANVYRKEIEAHMARTGGSYSTHDHGGNCDICGAYCIYSVVFYHALTNTYIQCGGDCAQKMEMPCNARDISMFRTACLEAQELMAGKRKAQAFLADKGLSAAWPVYSGDYCEKYEESTIRDIVGKLVKYGNISPAQTALIGTLLAKIAGRAQIELDRQAAHDAAKDVPVGKIEIVGTIVATKLAETLYGGILKMIVVSPDGWKVYGSVPHSLLVEVELRGQTVKFSANVGQSPTDRKFGFFKRPTKVQMLGVANV